MPKNCIFYSTNRKIMSIIFFCFKFNTYFCTRYVCHDDNTNDYGYENKDIVIGRPHGSGACEPECPEEVDTAGLH